MSLTGSQFPLLAPLLRSLFFVSVNDGIQELLALREGDADRGVDARLSRAASSWWAAVSAAGEEGPRGGGGGGGGEGGSVGGT